MVPGWAQISDWEGITHASSEQPGLSSRATYPGVLYDALFDSRVRSSAAEQRRHPMVRSFIEWVRAWRHRGSSEHPGPSRDAAWCASSAIGPGAGLGTPWLFSIMNRSCHFLTTTVAARRSRVKLDTRRLGRGEEERDGHIGRGRGDWRESSEHAERGARDATPKAEGTNSLCREVCTLASRF